MKKYYYILCGILATSTVSYSNPRGQYQNNPQRRGYQTLQQRNNLQFDTGNFVTPQSKRNGKLGMLGMLGQMTGNTLNQIGRATGNQDLQIAGFAAHQMGGQASAINSFRAKDGTFNFGNDTPSKNKKGGKNQNQQRNQKQQRGQQYSATPQSPLIGANPATWAPKGPTDFGLDQINTINFSQPARPMNIPAQQKGALPTRISEQTVPTHSVADQKNITKQKIDLLG